MSRVAIAAALLLMAGCYRRVEVTRHADTAHYHTNFAHGNYPFCAFTHEGHSYLAFYQGGLLHSASCTNAACVPLTLEKLREFNPAQSAGYIVNTPTYTNLQLPTLTPMLIYTNVYYPHAYETN